MEDVYNKLNRLGRYASRQELLDEIRDLNLELEREKDVLKSYKGRYEEKQQQSSQLSKKLETVKDYESALMKEHKDLEERYNSLKNQSQAQKQDIDVLKKELDTKDLSYFINRRHLMSISQTPRETETGRPLQEDWWLRERELDRVYGGGHKYWHWRPYLYRNHRELYDKYFPNVPYYENHRAYPYSYYDRNWDYPYRYSDYDYSLRRKLRLNERMDDIQKMTDDLRTTNRKMAHDLQRSVRSALE
jgi:hypothetical protein